MRGMVLSEKSEDDKKKLKSGLIGVAVLLIIGALAPTIIGEFTGVDLETLCEEGEEGAKDTCVKPGDFKAIITDGIGYVGIIIALVGFFGLIIVGVKY